MTDVIAGRICAELQKKGVSREQIDVGVRFTDYSGSVPKPGVVPGTAGDGAFQPQECYAAAIADAEKDAREYGKLLLAYTSNSIPANWKKLVEFKQRIDGEGELGNFKRGVPWLFTDFNPFTKSDDEIFIKILEGIAGARAFVGGQAGMVPGSSAYVLGLSRKFYSYVGASRGDGGLGMVRVALSADEKPTVNTTEQTALQAIQSSFGDCSEFGLIYYGILRMMGSPINPTVVDVDLDGDRYDHAVVAVRHDPCASDRYFADFTYDAPQVRGFKAGEVEITPLQFLAIHYGNLALRPPKDVATNERKAYAEHMFKAALRYDPYSSRIHYNLGNLYYDRGRYDEAIAEYKLAVEYNSRFANAYYNLSLAYGMKGAHAKAREMLGEYDRCKSGGSK